LFCSISYLFDYHHFPVCVISISSFLSFSIDVKGYLSHFIRSYLTTSVYILTPNLISFKYYFFNYIHDLFNVVTILIENIIAYTADLNSLIPLRFYLRLILNRYNREVKLGIYFPFYKSSMIYGSSSSSYYKSSGI
jgi:hypothetical protein